MLELLSPAGSPEAVVAAVQNGADAVYLGFGDYNARRNAKNFTQDDYAKASEYCRIRGVKTYITLNTLATDRELRKIAEQAKLASRLGADAILVQDLGVLRAVRESVPDMPVHASTQMSIHNLEGVKVAAAMGISRVVLARELSRDEIRRICEKSPIEIEVFAHGALCMCYSGQCYMSAVIGRRSGNRGLCAQPCRLPYSGGGQAGDYPLSLKDSCMAEYLHELEDMGVKCLKIEGRMRRPEYTAIVTDIYSRAIKTGRSPSKQDMELLEAAFSRQGFTDGYFKDHKGVHMLGIREDGERHDKLFKNVRTNYLNSEYQRVPVRFAGIIKKDEPARLVAEDDRKNRATAEGAVPEEAFHKELTAVALQTQLYKTGGTPFLCTGLKATVDEGLSLPLSEINMMRRDLLTEIFEKRKHLEPRREGNAHFSKKTENTTEPPILNISVQSADQLSPQLNVLSPYIVYVPLEEICTKPEKVKPFLENPNTTVAAIVPRVIHDGERQEIERFMRKAKSMGVDDALVSNLGHVVFTRENGFKLRGDFGLNVYNSETLSVLPALGLDSATLSFELRFEQIRDMAKPIDTELIVYGRLPLMITENCLVKNIKGFCACDTNVAITDRNGFEFPLAGEYGGRTTVLNSKKLFLADKSEDYMKSGLWGVRLAFTTENPEECVLVTQRYLEQGKYEPASYTRGLYYRGVE